MSTNDKAQRGLGSIARVGRGLFSVAKPYLFPGLGRSDEGKRMDSNEKSLVVEKTIDWQNGVGVVLFMAFDRCKGKERNVGIVDDDRMGEKQNERVKGSDFFLSIKKRRVEQLSILNIRNCYSDE